MKFFPALIPLICTLAALQGFDADLTEVIDVNQRCRNVIFRGDLPPTRRGSIRMGQVKKAMKSAYKAYKKANSGITMSWPSKYNIVMISNLTLDVAEEAEFLETAYDYFGGRGSDIPMKVATKNSKGTWYWWQVNPYYDFSPPVDEDISWRKLNALLGNASAEDVDDVLVNQSWDGRKLEYVTLIELLKTLMDRRQSRPTMIYIHSRRGYNRSTAIMCGYRMRYLSEDIETAYNNALISKTGIFQQQGLKGFLFFYKRYLELYPPS